MAESSSPRHEGNQKRDERHKQVMLGQLPADFLRVMAVSDSDQQISIDQQAALALQQQLSGGYLPSNVTGRLSISVVEAKLTKNYGMTRMDPYVRMRIGHSVLETHTDHNGAKNPRWNKVIHCFLSPSVNSIYLEMFDECAFSLDERIAWAHYTIPDTVFQGQVLNEWIELSGKQGDAKEGTINLVLSYTTIPAGSMVYPPQPMVAVMPAPYYVPTGVPYAVPHAVPQMYPTYGVPTVGGAPVTVAPHPQQQQQPQQQQPQAAVRQPVPITDADIDQIKEMFPSFEKDVIKTVLESHNGNKDSAINAMLSLSSGS